MLSTMQSHNFLIFAPLAILGHNAGIFPTGSSQVADYQKEDIHST